MIVCQTAVCRADLPNHLPLRHCCVSNLLFLFLLRLYARDASWYVAIPISRPLLSACYCHSATLFAGIFSAVDFESIRDSIALPKALVVPPPISIPLHGILQGSLVLRSETETGSVIDHCNTPSSLIIQ